MDERLRGTTDHKGLFVQVSHSRAVVWQVRTNTRERLNVKYIYNLIKSLSSSQKHAVDSCRNQQQCTTGCEHQITMLNTYSRQHLLTQLTQITYLLSLYSAPTPQKHSTGLSSARRHSLSRHHQSLSPSGTPSAGSTLHSRSRRYKSTRTLSSRPARARG